MGWDRIAEAFAKGGEMSLSQYRCQLEAKGIKLSGKDIDHIIPQAKGGVDHPWNYQAVSSSLNRSWQDGALFEKCLRAPIKFAKAVTVNYPGLAGATAGGVYFWGSKTAEKGVD